MTASRCANPVSYAFSGLKIVQQSASAETVVVYNPFGQNLIAPFASQYRESLISLLMDKHRSHMKTSTLFTPTLHTSLLPVLFAALVTTGCGGGGGDKPAHAAAVKSYELSDNWVLTETVKTNNCGEAVDLAVGEEYVNQYEIRQTGETISLYFEGELVAQGSIRNDSVTMNGRYVDPSVDLELLTTFSLTVVDDNQLTGTEVANFKDTSNGFTCRVQFGIAGERGEIAEERSKQSERPDQKAVELVLDAAANDSVNSEINPQDRYRLVIAAGDKVDVVLNGYDATGSNLDLYAFDKFGNELTASRNAGDAAETIQLSNDNTQDEYVFIDVVAQDTAAQTIDYTLEATAQE